MKRAICWILVAAIVLSLVSMVAFSVFAEPYEETAAAETPLLENDALEQVWEVELEGMPEEIVPGEASVPALTVIGNATVRGAKWVDTAKQPVKTFEDGKAYYLEITLAPQQGYKFIYWLDVYGNYQYADDVEICSSSEAKAWFRYSLMPGVGDVSLTVSGVEAGKPVSGVDMAVSADSKVKAVEYTISDRDGNDVTSGNFENGQIYWVTVMLEAEEGYDVEDYGWVEINGEHADSSYTGDGLLFATYRYSSCMPVGTVRVNTSGIEEGKPVSDVRVEILEGAEAVTLEEITVWDYDAGDSIFEGVFEANKRYEIDFFFSINDGYDPYQGMEVFLNDERTGYSYNTETLDLSVFFSTCQSIEEVYLDVTAPQVGDSVDDIAVTAVGDANYTVEWEVLDADSGESVTGTFQDNQMYELKLQLTAGEGYSFEEETSVTVQNYERDDIDFWVHDSGTYMYVNLDIDFRAQRVGWCNVYGMPEDIAPGAAVTLEELDTSDKVVLTDARWLDADRENAVTAFEDGKAYFAEITLAPAAGYAFRNWIEIYNDIYEYEIISENELKIWFRYSLMPGVGDVALTVTGLEVGKPISGVKAEVPADARVTLEAVEISDYFNSELLTSGNVEKGHRYNIVYRLAAKEGYDYEKVGTITVNGEERHDWSSTDGILEIYEEFSTFLPVGEVNMISSGLEVGNSVADIKLELPEDANVTLSKITVYNYNTGAYVKTFEEGCNYEIWYLLEAKEGYSPWDGCDVILNGEDPMHCYYGIDYIDVAEFFTTCQPIDQVHVTVAEPQVGDRFDDIAVSFDSDAYTAEYYWVDYDEEIGDTVQKEHTYYLQIALTPNEGYIFGENTAVTVNGAEESAGRDEYGLEMYVELEFDFRSPEVEDCFVTGVPETVEPGAAVVPEDLAVKGDASLVAARWVDADKQAVKTIEDGKLYYLELTLKAAEGYVFGPWLYVESEYDWAEYELISDTEVKAWFRYSLMPAVDKVEMTITGLEVGKPVSGATAVLPEDSKVTLEEVIVWDIQNDDVVQSGSFQDNSRYRITYVLKPKEGYDIEKLEEVFVDGESYWSWDCWDGELSVKYIFSTCEPVGDVELTSSGLELGGLVSDVKLEIDADAKVTLHRIEIYDYDSGDDVEGKFQKGRNYQIEYHLKPMEGYSPQDGVDIFLNGENADYSYSSTLITVTEFFTTCEVLDQISLTVTEPQVGGSIADSVVTNESELYTVEYEWYDWVDGYAEEGTFQKGHAYSLVCRIRPAEGYVFSENAQILFNGVEPDFYNVDEHGTYVYADRTWSFREKITKVEPLAIPESLSKGDALPWEFAVPEGANYTVVVDWYLLPEYQSVQKVDADGIYWLYLYLRADEGYEFDEGVLDIFGDDVEVDLAGDNTRVYLDKAYRVNVQEIDRIDITVAEPAIGNTPQEPGFPKDAKYVCNYVDWLCNDVNELRESDNCKVFQADKYHFLGLSLYAPTGYAFADTLAVYVNGNKVELAYYEDGTYSVTIGVGFGKLRPAGSVGTGDLDGVAGLDEDDAIYLLQHVLMPELFPVEQDVDFDGSGEVDEDDAIYLLQHVLMPDMFPL